MTDNNVVMDVFRTPGETAKSVNNDHLGNLKIGQLLTEKGFLSKKALAQALWEQKHNRSKRLGDLLVENKVVSRNGIEEIFKKAKSSNRIPQNAKIGEILIAAGQITQHKLKEVLISQRVNKKEKIGSLLIRNGLITEKQLLSALAQKLNLRFVNLEELASSPEAIKAVSNHIATKMRVIPIEFKGKTLVVATSDLTEPFLRESLCFNAGCAVEIVAATRQQILAAQKKYYCGEENDIDELLNGMNATSPVVGVVEEEFDVDQVSESDSAVIKFVNKVLLESITERASDIHFEPGQGNEALEIRFRVDGECRIAYQVPSFYKKAVISRLKILANLDIAERRKPQSGKIFLKASANRLEYRVETTPTAGGQEDAVLRVLANAKVLPIDEIGFSPSVLMKFKNILARPYGIILCVGPTGSGKTTTLHSALAEINTPKRKIWTAEDPVEITQKGLRQVQINKKIGLTFSEVMRSFLRADPDVIMVGEMRDSETAQIAVEASLTGHLVFSTLHTNNAAETVNRLLQIGIDPFHFADALLGILAQRLILKLCVHCKEPYNPRREEYEMLVRDYGPEMAEVDQLQPYSADLTLMRKKGCEKCSGTGYFGRVAIHELLLGSERLKQFIINRQAISEIRYLAMQDGMRPLRMDGIKKVLQGVTDYEQILKVCI